MAVTLPNIQEKVNIAKLYYQSLLDDYKSDLIQGVDDVPKNLNCLKWLIYALNADLKDVVNTDKTQALYVKLVTILGSYNVAFTVDPNVVIPNTTFTVISNTGKPSIDVFYADFIGNTYTNTSLVGISTFSVFDQNGGRFLSNGTQFTYSASGGFIIVDGPYEGAYYKIIFS